MATAATAIIPKVFAAINAVTAEVGKEGISKGRSNQQQGYKFRGIDDMYNVLSPLIAKHGLCIMPRMLNRTVTERTTQKGGALFYVNVEAEFDFICVEDGSVYTARTFGEAMDSADKATNKAMSAAYKYVAMQAFCIPTEGDNDADATTHEVAPKAETKAAPVTSLEARQKLLSAAPDMDALKAAWNIATDGWKDLPEDWKLGIKAASAQRAHEIKTAGAKKAAKPEEKPFPGDMPPNFDNMDQSVPYGPEDYIRN